MSTYWRSGRSKTAPDDETEDAIADAVQSLNRMTATGTAVPDSNTGGYVYFMINSGGTCAIYARARLGDSWVKVGEPN